MVPKKKEKYEMITCERGVRISGGKWEEECFVITCEHEESENHDEGVSEVEERADEALDVELADVVVHAVEEEVDGSEAARHEGAPPPVVVLGTQVEVAEEDGGFRARHDEDDEDEEQETEHVVQLVRPTKHNTIIMSVIKNHTSVSQRNNHTPQSRVACMHT